MTMSFWSFDSVRSVLGAQWAARAGPGASSAEAGLSTDSRAIKARQVFVALRGERTDGHLYLEEAAKAGASLLVVDEKFAGVLPAGPAALRVADTRRALLRLAAAYRRTLDGTRVVAVTGSNGKTTTTRMIDAVLSGTLRGTASIKSFNNAVGVPLTILAARPGDHYLICEIGTSAPGEVAVLARAAAPDVSVITSIGREHTATLGTLRQIAQEEASQVEFLRRGGLAVIHAEAPHLREIVEAKAGEPHGFSVVTFGTRRDADLRVGDVRQEPDGVRFTINARHEYRVPLLGAHNAVNAAAAVAVARRFGVEHDAIAAGLARVTGADMRLQVSSVAGVRVINDAYNANPDSMAAAIALFAEAGRGAARLVAVLGDMLELGEAGPSWHAEVVARALDPQVGLDLLVLVGPRMSAAARGLEDERVVIVENPSDGRVAAIAQRFRPGDTVLLKGSRGMKIERVLAALHTRAGGKPVTTPRAAEVRVKRPRRARARRT